MPRLALIIEDDPDIAELVAEVLTEEGHSVEIHERLAEGAVDAQVHLVITDLFVVRGYDLQVARDWISRVRTAFPNAAVVVSTAHDPAATDGAPALGADALVLKPFDIGVLTETVESLLGA